MRRVAGGVVLFLVLLLVLGETLLVSFSVRLARAEGLPAVSVLNPGPSSNPSKWNASLTVRDYDSPRFTFYSNETLQYSTFFANVTIANVSTMFGYQFGILYDNTTIQYTDSWLPSDFVFKGAQDSGLGIIPASAVDKPVDATHRMLRWGCSFVQNFDHPWSFNGSGVLGQVQFKVVCHVSASQVQSSQLMFNSTWTTVYYWPDGQDTPTTNVGSFVYAGEGVSTRYAWPMFHGNPAHSGCSESPSPGTNQTKWNFTTTWAVDSSPAIADGKVFFGCNDSMIYAVDQYSGAEIWNFSTGGSVQSSPAVADGKVFVGSFFGAVYCLDASSGHPIWNFTAGDMVFSSPAVANGMVYVGSWDDYLYCLPENDPNSDGIISRSEVVWNFSTGDWITSSPAVVGDRVFVGSLDGKVYCLDAFNGGFRWDFQMANSSWGSSVLSSPAVVGGRVYVGSDNGNLYCLNAVDGGLVWNYSTGGRVRSSPAVLEGMVFVGSDDGVMYCLDALTGGQVWNCTTAGPVGSSPAVADLKVYVGMCDGRMSCLNASNGQLIWSYAEWMGQWSSPAIADGMVFVGTIFGVYAFGNVVLVNDYPSIQQALDAASSGAVALIDPGVYNESIVVNKPLIILGKKGTDPIFQGGGSGIAIVLLSNASGSVITGIVVTNWNQGVLLLGAHDCQIYGNIISETSLGCIALDSAEHNVIYGNVICQSLVGINMTGAANNVIYHNSFINIAVLLSISTSVGNIWDNGYPSGGNYWADYHGPDTHSGPFQNVTGSDGIGDVPRAIDANNVDHYPLMIPNEYKLNPISGDADLNARVDMGDVVAFCKAFGSTPGKPNWNACCDTDNNGKITMGDIIEACKNFGKHYP